MVKESHNLKGNVSVNFPRLIHKRFQLEVHSEREIKTCEEGFFSIVRQICSFSFAFVRVHPSNQAFYYGSLAVFARKHNKEPSKQIRRIIESGGRQGSNIFAGHAPVWRRAQFSQAAWGDSSSMGLHDIATQAVQSSEYVLRKYTKRSVIIPDK